MSDAQQNDTSVNLNRLRAAAGLIPIIEAGLNDGKMTIERACHMASFCEWATEGTPDDTTATDIADTVRAGLDRLKSRLTEIK